MQAKAEHQITLLSAVLLKYVTMIFPVLSGTCLYFASKAES
jgi:hypothetical protein